MLIFRLFLQVKVTMRLDLFLKTSRLIQRRTLAQEFCDAGLVQVNGAAAKSSREIRPGDEIVIRRRDRAITFRVNTVPTSKQIAKSAAAKLYQILSDDETSS